MSARRRGDRSRAAGLRAVFQEHCFGESLADLERTASDVCAGDPGALVRLVTAAARLQSSSVRVHTDLVARRSRAQLQRGET